MLPRKKAQSEKDLVKLIAAESEKKAASVSSLEAQIEAFRRQVDEKVKAIQSKLPLPAHTPVPR